jgi:protein phosphatase
MIRVDQAHLFIAARTHPGMTGKNNEDSFAVSAYHVSQYNPTPSLFAIVSDGIGGHRAGEVASELAVNMISHAVAGSDAGNPPAIFQQSFYEASEAIFAEAQKDESRLGMGATVVCAWIIGPQLYAAGAGDSRIYLMRNSQIRMLTRDHSWVQEALDRGLLKPEQMTNHPNSHVIRRYLGSAEPPEADLRLRIRQNESDSQAKANQGMTLQKGDVIILCTDGLTDLVSDAEILATVYGNQKIDQAAQALIDLANARGGHDNITVVLLQAP